LEESEEVLLIFCKKYRKIGTIASLTYLFKGLGFEHFEDSTPKGFPVKEISESNNQNAINTTSHNLNLEMILL